MQWLNFDNLVQAIGWIGSFQVVIAYYLVSTHKIASTSKNYQWLNLIGGSFLVVLTLYVGAYPSAFVNIIWVIIAGYSLLKPLN